MLTVGSLAISRYTQSLIFSAARQGVGFFLDDFRAECSDAWVIAL